MQISNNYDIQQENEHLQLEKKNKTDVAKLLVYSAASLLATVVGAVVIKNILDKVQENKKFKEITGDRIVDGVTLSVADQKWIRKYMFNPNQVYPLCWNNVMFLYLAGPEFRAKKYLNTKLAQKNINGKIINSKIIRGIDYINQIFADPSRNDCFLGNVNIDFNQRFTYDGGLLKNSGEFFLWYDDRLGGSRRATNVSYDGAKLMEYGVADAVCYNKANINATRNYIINSIINNYHNYADRGIPYNSPAAATSGETKPGLKTLVVSFGGAEKYGYPTLESFFGNNDINFLKDQGYYPTFVAVYDDRVDYSSCPHWMGAYIVYDTNHDIKFFLWANGCRKGVKVLSKEEGLEKLKEYGAIAVKYSSQDIVDEFYTPEFLQCM